MNVAVLWVEGEVATLRALYGLLQASGLEVDGTWKKGEQQERGGVHSASGFKMCVADAATSDELVEGVRVFLTRCVEQGVTFAASDVAADLSLGMTVGGSKQYTASVTFSSSDLLSLGQHGVALRVAAYPSSGE